MPTHVGTDEFLDIRHAPDTKGQRSSAPNFWDLPTYRSYDMSKHNPISGCSVFDIYLHSLVFNTTMAVKCSGKALVSINAVALH